YAVGGLAGWWRGFNAHSWLWFVLIVGLGVLAEAVNTTFEVVGTKLAKETFRIDQLTLGQTESLVESHGVRLETVPDSRKPQKHDASVRRIKDLSAGIVYVVAIIDFTIYGLLMAF